MSLNIKNPRTVALVRELAARTGQTQTAAIEDAVRSRIVELDSRQVTTDSQVSAKRARAERVLAELRGSITMEEKAGLRAAAADLYDAHGLPR